MLKFSAHATASLTSDMQEDRAEAAASRPTSTTAMWVDLAYPFEARPLGVLEHGSTRSTLPIVAAQVVAVGKALKAGDRDMLSDCGFATANWSRVLAAAGVAVRVVGGFGQHIETVPATPPERRGGYLTDDDGLVQHWWLMLEPNGLIFDPTAHQFDDRGGLEISRYRVEGMPVTEWRRDWQARASGFPVVPIGSGEATWKSRLGLRGGR